MHPIKKITILLVMYMLSGCATISKNYNTPFINTDETITLEYGMNKSTVRNTLGYPLYVDMGNKSSEKIIWVYEVRTIEVKSDIFMGGKISVAKTSDYTKHAAPIHRLELTFVDNKLISWGPSAPDEDEYTDEDEEEEPTDDLAENDEEAEVKKQKKKKKIKLFFMPKASMLLQGYEESYRRELGYDDEYGYEEEYYENDCDGYHDNPQDYTNDYYEENCYTTSTSSGSYSGPSGGFYMGLETQNKVRFGVEGRLGFTNLAAMGVLEIPLPWGPELSLLVGGGIDVAFSDDDGKNGGEDRWSIMKVGVSKSINEKISATAEIFPFSIEDGDEENSLGILVSARLHL